MNYNNVSNELKRLNFEDFLWVVFAIICFLNIYGDHNEKEYLKTNNYAYENKANHIFELTLIVTLLIYLYFFARNYKAYENASEDKKNLYQIKLFGSVFLLAGIICLIYFQFRDSSFIGTPAL